MALLRAVIYIGMSRVAAEEARAVVLEARRDLQRQSADGGEEDRRSEEAHTALVSGVLESLSQWVGTNGIARLAGTLQTAVAEVVGRGDGKWCVVTESGAPSRSKTVSHRDLGRLLARVRGRVEAVQAAGTAAPSPAAASPSLLSPASVITAFAPPPAAVRASASAGTSSTEATVARLTAESWDLLQSPALAAAVRTDVDALMESVAAHTLALIRAKAVEAVSPSASAPSPSSPAPSASSTASGSAPAASESPRALLASLLWELRSLTALLMSPEDPAEAARLGVSGAIVRACREAFSASLGVAEGDLFARVGEGVGASTVQVLAAVTSAIGAAGAGGAAGVSGPASHPPPGAVQDMLQALAGTAGGLPGAGGLDVAGGGGAGGEDGAGGAWSSVLGGVGSLLGIGGP